MAKILRNIDQIIDTQGNELSVANPVEMPAPVLSFRNKIINGNFQVNQRNDSNPNRNLSHSLFHSEADRWKTTRANVGGNGRANVSYVNGGIKYQISEAVDPITTSAYFSIRQIIEGMNCVDLVGEQVTLSFKARTNKAGNYGVVVQGDAQSITVSSEDASAENKVFYSKTFTVPNDIAIDHTAGIQVDICLAAHSDRAGQYYEDGGTQVNLFESTENYFELYEVQLEKGPVATPFEHRPYGLELSLCQRYFYKHPSWEWGYQAAGLGSSYARTKIDFKVTMRTIPTISGISYADTSGSTGAQAVSQESVTLWANPTLSGSQHFEAGWTANAEL